MINIHDSQHNLTERSPHQPETVKKFLKAQIANRTGSMPSDTQLPVFLQEDRAASVALPRQPTVLVPNEQGATAREKRGSNAGDMLQHARIRRNSSVLHIVLAYHRTGESVPPASPSEANMPAQPESTRRKSSIKSPKETLSKVGNWLAQK
ncbi:hypothetical protein RvY_03789 [Ramazzottius varieornatus]|uniref:Uncharacterized protein n=1 Tax=Ramazzottius varieornatus TaxID=947166 RepID=A0A1D1UQ39_RAMVA|nr:hypothetical protein RvY_03789 [Ramazzottius varieornatus]